MIGLVLSNPNERYNLTADYGGRGDNNVDSLGNRTQLDDVDLLRVLLVRHGESINNQIQSSIANSADLAAAGPTAREQRWLRRRQDDPPLSEKGRTESELLADFYAPILARVARNGRVQIMPSPMLRTCQTAWPLYRNLGGLQGNMENIAVVLHPDVHGTEAN
eukprot:SAG31_NODE_3712_length_3957_cov_9.372041_4_plen_163_part_00